jgi:glycosyltransferase involved in cell wall biosynthesis
MKKKILYIVEAMGGGVFTYIVNLSNQLVKNYDMYIAYGIRKQTPLDYVSYFNNEVHLIKVNNFEREIDLVKDIKAYIEIKKIAENIEPDIIHFHSSKAGVIGRIALRKSKAKLFYTPHGYSFLMDNCSQLRRTIYKMIERLCAISNCTTICCSKGEYEESLLVTQNTTYVNNGINTLKINEILANVKKNDNEFRVFTIGRICAQKNPKLFNDVAKKMPNVKFIWIGDGELRGELHCSNIEITGWINEIKVIEKAVNADVFLLPSLWEGLPISLLEAMYMRKTCIVSDVVGNRDVIKNGINGYICHNIDEYVSVINEIKRNSCILVTENAHREVQDKYNTVYQAEQYIQIYED